MKIQLPEKVKFIIGTLEQAGYEAYAVGGCVRDMLLGREPEDWDITTSAKPRDVKALFSRTVDTGLRHGTVTVLLHGEGFEVTTYRIDGMYEDGRHPKNVTFTANLREDLQRRDFTVNAMAYSEKGGLVDAFGGAGDLRQKVIRCVGNARERFSEDALRMMRAVRFSAQLGFTVEEKTRAAVGEMALGLSRVSAERIQAELVKILTSPRPAQLRTAWQLGLTAVFLPEFDRAMGTPQHHPHHMYSVGEHTLHSMEAIGPDKILRLSMLFHDLSKPLVHTVDENGIDHFKGHGALSYKIAEEVLRRLKFDNYTIDRVSKLVLYHDYAIQETPQGVRRAASKIGAELLPLLFLVKRADVAAQSSYLREEKLRTLSHLEALWDEVESQGQCLTIKGLAVTGRDLMAVGMTPGKEMGRTLERLLELVLEHPECNTKEYLLTQI